MSYIGMNISIVPYRMIGSALTAPEILHSLAYAMTGGFGLEKHAVDTDAESVNRYAEYFQAALMLLQDLHDGPNMPLPEQLGLKDSSESQLMKAYAQLFLIFADLATHNRRLFMTASGYVGVGPAITKSGDDVLVLFGSFLPIISRRLAGDRRQVVGHGASYHMVHDKLRDWRGGALTDEYFTFL